MGSVDRGVSGGDYAWYNWDIGFNVINEENSNGTLSMTYTMDSPAAQVAGILPDASTTDPGTGTYRYYSHDNLGSTRRLRAGDKSSLGAYEYTPYGQAYATSGVALGDLAGAFTGKSWDDTAQLYYFPYRYYSPDAARWLTRDPLGMVDGPNVYAYVKGSPVNNTDPYGLITGWELLAIIISLLDLCATMGGWTFSDLADWWDSLRPDLTDVPTGCDHGCGIFDFYVPAHRVRQLRRKNGEPFKDKDGNEYSGKFGICVNAFTHSSYPAPNG